MMPAKLPMSSVKGVLGRFVKPWIPPNVVFWMTTERLVRVDESDQGVECIHSVPRCDTRGSLLPEYKTMVTFFARSPKNVIGSGPKGEWVSVRCSFAKYMAKYLGR